MKNKRLNQITSAKYTSDALNKTTTADKADFTPAIGKFIVSDLEREFGTTPVFVKIPRVASFWLNNDIRKESLHEQFRKELDSMLLGIAFEALTFITDEETQQKFLSELDSKVLDVTIILPICGNIAYTLPINENLDLAEIQSLDELIGLMETVVFNFDKWVSHYFKLNTANELDLASFENQTSHIFADALELVRQSAEQFFEIGSAAFNVHNNQQREEVVSNPHRERPDKLTKAQVH